MDRYGKNLLDWKTLTTLSPTKCYTGDECTDSNTRLGMNLRFKEYELEKYNLLYTQEKMEVLKSIISLKCEIKEMREKFETEKSQLISKASYQMFPDNTLIHCQLISDNGKNIKSDGSFGNELVWCKVSDQRCFKSDILYAVNIIKNREADNEWFSTRASITNWPRPNQTPTSFLKNCIKDDSINTPYQGVFYPPDKLVIGNLNLGEIGGYADESGMSEENTEEYKGNDVTGEECHDDSCGRGIKRMLSSTTSPYVYHGEENPEDDEKKYVEDTRKKMKEKFKKDGMESDASFLTSGVSGMDGHNLKMANVIADKGMDEAVKQMFVHPTEGRQMSYSEMRSFYG